MPDAEFSLIVAAAGSGVRLNASIPKAFFKIEHQTTLLEFQISKFSKLPCEIVVVVSRQHNVYFQQLPEWLFKRCKFVFQEYLNGTASAIYSALRETNVEKVVTCWVDQVGASPNHITMTQSKLDQKGIDFVIPLLKKINPYVVAELSIDGKIAKWNFEKAVTSQEMNFTDTGVFGFKRTKMLEELKSNKVALSGREEFNFLDVLLQVADYPETITPEVFDQNLTLAINTLEDVRHYKNGGMK